MKLKQERGQLTQRIKDKSKELLGYEITEQELRLIPYIQYCLINEHRLDAEKISIEEVAILTEWERKGFMQFSEKIKATKEFWDTMSELIWLGYVDIN